MHHNFDHIRLSLITAINQTAETFLCENTFLHQLESNLLTGEEWRIFAVQRYLSASPFEQLLEAAIHSTDAIGAFELASALQQNLNDERGIDKDGVRDESRAHATWRKHFYSAIGVSDHDLDAIPGPAAQQYFDCLQDLITKGSAMKLAGAVLALEAIIPREFAKVKVGRDKRFPHLQKEARRYIDDHIIHDAQSHYPDLLAVLSQTISDNESLTSVQQGIWEITRAKRRFYDLLSSQCPK